MAVVWKICRKKPVEVCYREPMPQPGHDVELIKTLEGATEAVPGRDYVISGVEGELYPINRKIFEKIYEVVP